MVDALARGVEMSERRVGPSTVWWVYVPQLESGAAANARIGEIRAQGTEDVSPVVEDPKFANGISLGVFASRASAEYRRDKPPCRPALLVPKKTGGAGPRVWPRSAKSRPPPRLPLQNYDRRRRDRHRAGQFNTLAKALTAAGLIDTLKGPGPFTVFAPTDEAFAKIPAHKLDAPLADKAALTYHVVPARWSRPT